MPSCLFIENSWLEIGGRLLRRVLVQGVVQCALLWCDLGVYGGRASPRGVVLDAGAAVACVHQLMFWGALSGNRRARFGFSGLAKCGRSVRRMVVWRISRFLIFQLFLIKKLFLFYKSERS